MTNQKIEIKIKYLLHECSAPKKFRPDLMIKIDYRDFDHFLESKQGFEVGGWIIYYIDSERIKMSHAEMELWECLYLRADIN